MRMTLLIASLLLVGGVFAHWAPCFDGACGARAWHARGCRGVPVSEACADGACVARPVERAVVCPAAPECPDGACVARPLPPRHRPDRRQWRERPRPVREGRAAPAPLSPAERAARLRARAARLEQMADDIEAGKDPTPPAPKPEAQTPKAEAEG